MFDMEKKNFFSRARAIAISAVLLASCVGTNVALAADTQTEQKAAPISEVVNDSGLDYDYARALQYSMYFYDANMCGYDTDPETGRKNRDLEWRGDCHVEDYNIPLKPMDLEGADAKFGTNLSQEFIDEYSNLLRMLKKIFFGNIFG